MRRIFLFALTLVFAYTSFAQDSTASAMVKKAANSAAEARSGDHFMLQLGYTTWSGKPDSINTKGFPRTFNAYLMLDFPFKTNPHFSVALGPGIATDNIYFDKMYIGLKDNTPTLRFDDLSDTSHFKKYKMGTAYLEAPVELRYRTNPADDRRSVKFALGAKVGFLVGAKVKGKEFEDKAGNTLLDYTSKEASNKFLNKNRLSVMGRVGYGHFTLFASYAITPLFKEGLGPTVRPLTFGLTLSGL